MSGFLRERWTALSPLLDRVLEMAPEERSGWLESVRVDDAALAGELQALLDEHRRLKLEGFLS